MIRLDKDTKKLLKEAQERIIWEAKKKKELLSRHTDYDYLQQLIDRSNNNQNLVIRIHKTDGEIIELFQRYKEDDHNYNNFNGNPTEEEIR